MRPAVAGLALLMLPGDAAVAQQPADDLIPALYRCADGAAVPVVYITPASGEGYAVALVAGRLVALRAAPSASGARYLSRGTGEVLELWNKGDRLTVATGGDAPDRVIHADCVATAP
ncbi:MliC family protein [Paracoccus spongiarum]|uniref:MliC family protein n=1 Tax=Paracoccus spongiarum TaxID=3064387 RepID=A0ABT9JGG0_9RHOB|nr:MliC family protein [Paracoccus sp. 2205BS29-5]MDP5308922.1 MliC family protein [Paracoccus sp. 2205BS29-5]